MAPPVPIPNTEVKRCSPDDSASIGCAKVGRRQYPRPVQVKTRTGRPFFVAQGRVNVVVFAERMLRASRYLLASSKRER